MKNLAYVLLSIGLTILCWGGYGPLLRVGTMEMKGSHWLPFLFVGVAYFLIAVVATSALLVWRGEPGGWNMGGTPWSFLAGVVTAVGALGVILALANKGSPIFVMPLVFGGAPVINTLLSMWMSKTHREAGSLFYAGLILVVAGAVAVLVFNPPPAPPHAGDGLLRPPSGLDATLGAGVRVVGAGRHRAVVPFDPRPLLRCRSDERSHGTSREDLRAGLSRQGVPLTSTASAPSLTSSSDRHPSRRSGRIPPELGRSPRSSRG
jgi:hypothetical protein